MAEGTKRYTLVMPDVLIDQLTNVAEDRHTTVAELLRRFIKLGLIATNVEKTPGAALLIREGDTMREIVLI